ncbi:MAG: ribose transport system permease protein, partial [Gaiellales bacterium]|nr:ribose transport system permease protein [Gaiellales bacterium]
MVQDPNDSTARPVGRTSSRRPDVALIGRTGGRYGTIIGLLALCVFFALKSPVFLSKDNFLGILNASAVNGIIATGRTVTLVMLAFDLSVGYSANTAGRYAAGG